MVRVIRMVEIGRAGTERAGQAWNTVGSHPSGLVRFLMALLALVLLIPALVLVFLVAVVLVAVFVVLAVVNLVLLKLGIGRRTERDPDAGARENVRVIRRDGDG